MKYKFLLLPLIFVACQTTPQKSACKCSETTNTKFQNQTESELASKNLTSAQTLDLASQLLNNGAPEEALSVLNNIPNMERNAQYKKLKHDVVNKIVMNYRYKVRILYEQSIQQEGKIKTALLLQSKQILETIIKDYPEYDDMYAVKNNLKQIERELTKKL